MNQHRAIECFNQYLPGIFLFGALVFMAVLKHLPA